MAPLTGSELLAFIKKQEPDCGKMEMARLAGYYKTREDGTVVALVPQLMNAIAEANGIHIEGKRGHQGARKRSYVTTCHATGIIMVGKIYTEEAGIKKGDKFEIVVSPGSLQINRIEEADQVDSEPDDADFEEEEELEYLEEDEEEAPVGTRFGVLQNA
jgi:hypothetical protein